MVEYASAPSPGFHPNGSDAGGGPASKFHVTALQTDGFAPPVQAMYPWEQPPLQSATSNEYVVGMRGAQVPVATPVLLCEQPWQLMPQALEQQTLSLEHWPVEHWLFAEQAFPVVIFRVQVPPLQ